MKGERSRERGMCTMDSCPCVEPLQSEAPCLPPGAGLTPRGESAWLYRSTEKLWEGSLSLTLLIFLKLFSVCQEVTCHS